MPCLPRRAVALLSSAVLGGACVTAGVLGACASDDTTGGTTSGDAASRPETAGDEGIVIVDGGTNGDDARTPQDPGDAGVVIVDGPGEAGAPCSFNRECNAALRCECNETTGCECKPGTRGTGKNGIDGCVDGNACASSLCVEGPPDAGSFCSDECDSSAECTGKLPLCSTIAFVGRVCIRQPPM